MQLARQCWDETRHSAILYRRLLAMGGRKGEFPVMNYEWGVTQLLDSLPARLAVQNRTFEGGEMDLLRQQEHMWSEVGDEDTAALMDALLADEVQHVRYANRWLKQMARENARTLLRRADERLKSLGHEEEVRQVGTALTSLDDAQRMAGKLDQSANSRAGDAAKIIAAVLDAEAQR